jgi:hypothetical protein
MRIEGCGLEHLSKAELHLVGECGEMRGRDLMILVLDQVQVLDQEIAAARPVAEQKLDVMGGGRIDLAAFWRRLGAPATFAGMIEFANLVDVVSH